MSYCINPHCPKSVDPANAKNRICRNCGSDILLQGRYQVLKLLGHGGFGKTFEVDDGGTLKVLKVLTENNLKAIELFQQEAKVLSQLDNPGIPRVESDAYFTVLPKNSSVPLHCLVMEKIDGLDLEQWMECHNYQPISQSQAFNWLKQLVEILTKLHAHQYFHRDIKPQNIMLRPSGQLVLIDFGAVRQVTTTILVGNSHTRIISQGYSPPEQQNGYSVPQSDFFALGRTFIFLLTGKEPQDKEIYNPLTNELNWRKYALNISPLFADLIDNLMAPSASQRPQNTEFILLQLQNIEKELHNTHKLYQSRIFQSASKVKSPALSTSVATVSVGVIKSLNTSYKQTPKSKIYGQFFIGLGVILCSGFAITAINQSSIKTQVSPVENIPITIPSIVSSPVNQIPETINEAKPKPAISPLNLPVSETVEAEQAQSKAVEKEKRQAAFKAEQERQAAIKREFAARAEKEKLEVLIKEKKIQDDLLVQKRRQDALLIQRKRQQEAIEAEKPQIKRTALRTKPPQKNTIKARSNQQLPVKQKKDVVNQNNTAINTKNPWEYKDTIPKASDELEKVIREGNQ
ncbi:serine/threonine protein kinase [Tolypothrix tenuis PCC 7101]|uniref:non-specific serine/threonine protein kinase n=1 Tax=Tolypothrix tenuis PCC 7101 TaxID=231146 RepID=A0A1Z4N678_9CYAN|nr:protein kinase [Aulosira sp. FACHB-113]BAZ01214.1 serine/threonine protein kinase [Tolypothrix tenuis PCC 7101]BAZ74864.1 serine/threonine protein kinase [Aulosira laxa NIES-50]